MSDFYKKLLKMSVEDAQEITRDGDILEDNIRAHYRNGVLEIEVSTEDKPEVIDEGRHIEIED